MVGRAVRELDRPHWHFHNVGYMQLTSMDCEQTVQAPHSWLDLQDDFFRKHRLRFRAKASHVMELQDFDSGVFGRTHSSNLNADHNFIEWIAVERQAFLIFGYRAYTDANIKEESRSDLHSIEDRRQDRPEISKIETNSDSARVNPSRRFSSQIERIPDQIR